MCPGKSSNKQLVFDKWLYLMVAVNNQFINFCTICSTRAESAKVFWGHHLPDICDIAKNTGATNSWCADIPGGHRYQTRLMRQ